MIEKIRKLLRMEQIKNVRWWKNGTRVQLKQMKVIGHSEDVMVEVFSHCYTRILSISIHTQFAVSEAYKPVEQKNIPEYRTVIKNMRITVGVGKFKPVFTLYLPTVYETLESSEAMKKIQNFLYENTDSNFLTCTSQQFMQWCRLGKM